MNTFRKAILDSFTDDDGSIPADIVAAVRLSEQHSGDGVSLFSP